MMMKKMRIKMELQYIIGILITILGLCVDVFISVKIYQWFKRWLEKRKARDKNGNNKE